jgi:hypothetical protein
LYGCQDGRPNEGVRMTVSEIKQAIIAHENQTGLRYQIGDGVWRYRVRGGVADSAIFSSRIANDSTDSFADEFAKQTRFNGAVQRGIVWDAADKPAGSRAMGWAAIRDRLYATLPTRERPGLFIGKNCQHLLRTLKELPRDNKKMDDCPADAEDHLPDVLRYILTKKHTPAVSFKRRWVA